MAKAPPLTHHEILDLVEPFSRRGRQVDLAASQRVERRLAFKPVAHGDGVPALPGLQETLQLECPRPDRFVLTRTLTLPGGLKASLEAEGAQPGELLARVEAVPPQRQFRAGTGYQIALSQRISGESRFVPGGEVSLQLRQGIARVDGVTLSFKVSSVKGIPAEIEITPDASDPLALPDDVLAVLGWAWARLIATRHGWGSRVRLRGQGRERGQDAEAKLELAAAHLARLLSEPPRQYHERLTGARWSVVFRRLMPLLAAVGLVAAAAGVAKLDLAENSPIRMLIFHAPPLVLMIFFSLNELPRVEIPPLPRASKAPSWRKAPPAPAAA